MNSVIDMLGSDRFLGALALGWMLTPIGFILVGLVFESRLVPLWHGQSRAFIPGDLALGVLFAVGYYLLPQVDIDSWWVSPKFAVLALVVGCMVCYIMRTKIDGPGYDPRALDSPTKIYHDFLLYIGYLVVLTLVCVPAILMATSWDGGNLGPKLVALVAFVIWVGGLVHDGTNPNMPYPKMHITNFEPIWRR